MNKDLMAYALDFVSFLLQTIEYEELLNINEIILFGSVSRGVATKKSDVDIFINVFKKNKGFEKKVSVATKKFYESDLFKRYWQLRYVENEIKCIVGKLKEWTELEPSIIANGIVLWGKYRGMLKGRTDIIVYWDKIKGESRRVLLSKKIYGYKYKNKKYTGLIEETEARKLGANCIIVPSEHFQRFSKVFKDFEITIKMIYVTRL